MLKNIKTKFQLLLYQQLFTRQTIFEKQSFQNNQNMVMKYLDVGITSLTDLTGQDIVDTISKTSERNSFVGTIGFQTIEGMRRDFTNKIRKN